MTRRVTLDEVLLLMLAAAVFVASGTWSVTAVAEPAMAGFFAVLVAALAATVAVKAASMRPGAAVGVEGGRP